MVSSDDKILSACSLSCEGNHAHRIPDGDTREREFLPPGLCILLANQILELVKSGADVLEDVEFY